MSWRRIAVIVLILFMFPLFYWEIDSPSVQGDHGSSQASRAILNVNKNQTYDSIQDAIDNSDYGDTIRLFAGNYTENIYLNNGVKLQGSGPEKTVLHGLYADWIVSMGDDCTLEGITVNTTFYYSYCIMASGGNAVVRNCAIEGGYYGIYAFSGSSIDVIGNTFSNTWRGLTIDFNDDVNIRNNTFSCSEWGMVLGYSTNVELRDNDLQDCMVGFQYNDELLEGLNVGDGNLVNGRPLVYMKDESDQTAPTDCGQLILYRCSNITVANLTKEPPTKLNLYRSENTTVANCVLRMSMTHSNNNLIMDNHFKPIERVLVETSHNNRITGNTVSGAFYGIYQSSCHNNVYEKNTFKDNQMGSIVYYSDNCTFQDNTFQNNSNVDLEISEGYGHHIKKNKFLSELIGLRIYDSSSINQGTGFHSIVENEFVDQDRAMRITNTNNLFMSKNKMTRCGITLFGYDSDEWTTHVIEESNTIDGEPIYYFNGEQNPQVPQDAGQVIFADCTDVLLEDRSFEACTTGVILGLCHDVRLENIIFKDSYVGVLAAWCTDIDIEDITCDDIWAAVYLAGCTNLTLKDSTFSSSDYGGIVMDGSSACEIFNNSLNEAGIFLYTQSHSNITGNRCSGGTTGIQVYSSHNINVTQNTCEQNFYGIYLYDGRSCNVMSNTCISGTYGIYLDYSNYNTFEDNIAESNQVGLYLRTSDFNQILGNQLNFNHIGMMINNSESLTITNNTLSQNTGVGAMLNKTLRVTLVNNLFANNTGYAVSIDPEGPFLYISWDRFHNSTESLVYFNRFENNNNGGTQAQDNGYQNQWNENVGGNLWFDWTGPDEDENGFVDLPYPIDGGAGKSDLLPLSIIPKGDTDGDGYFDHIEEMFGTDINDNGSVPPDADKDLVPNEMDPDIDGDGYLNKNDEDMDGDGHDNEEDKYPKDPDRWEDEEDDWPILAIVFPAVIVIFVVFFILCLIIIMVKRKNRVADVPEGDEMEGEKGEGLENPP